MNEDVKARFLAELGRLARTHPEGSEEYLHRIWTDWNRAQVYREAGLPAGESNLDPSALEALQANRHLVQRLEGRRWSVVAKARAEGASWQQIADALGITRQSAHAAYRDAVARMREQGLPVSSQQLAAVGNDEGEREES
jgi:DNA-directed RNA polymerase specialized sigma24 family protein